MTEFIIYPTVLVLVMVFVIMFTISFTGAWLDRLQVRRVVNRITGSAPRRRRRKKLVVMRIHNVYTGHNHVVYVDPQQAENTKQFLINRSIGCDYDR